MAGAASASAKRGKAEKPKEATPAEVAGEVVEVEEEQQQQQRQLDGRVSGRLNVAKEAPAKNGVSSTTASADGGGEEEEECRFVGAPIRNEEARQKWPKRYLGLGKVVFLVFPHLFVRFLSNLIQLTDQSLGFGAGLFLLNGLLVGML